MAGPLPLISLLPKTAHTERREQDSDQLQSGFPIKIHYCPNLAQRPKSYPEEAGVKFT